MIQKGNRAVFITTGSRPSKNHSTSLQRGPKQRHLCYRKIFKSKGEGGIETSAQEHIGEDKGRSEAIFLDMLMHCFHCTTLLLLFNPLTRTAFATCCALQIMWERGGFGNFAGSPVNEPLPCKVRLAEKDPGHRNGGNPFLEGGFFNRRLNSVENTKHYGAACEFPLAVGHEKKRKEKKKE